MNEIDDIIEQIRCRNVAKRNSSSLNAFEWNAFSRTKRIWHYVAVAACVALIVGVVLLCIQLPTAQAAPLMACGDIERHCVVESSTTQQVEQQSENKIAQLIEDTVRIVNQTVSSISHTVERIASGDSVEPPMFYASADSRRIDSLRRLATADCSAYVQCTCTCDSQYVVDFLIDN
ncbi:MAG: hypothetical protein MJZ42_03065 [Bacteroidales bacterium]|nr:hypothetical protein [Bacteroidales bacterium]